MAQTKADRWRDVHGRAIERFNRCYSSQREIRLQCLQDRRFVYVPGAQWEGDLGDQFANRPRFEVNKVHMSVMRILSEYRSNRITVDFRAKDGKASEETADMLDGLFRADEQECNAREAYDTAFDEGVSGGMGAWRLRCDYEDEEDEENEQLRIRIEPIYDADSSVFFDIDAKRRDKRDATYCFVISSISPSQYRDQYGEEPVSFGKVDRLVEFDWFSPNMVYIAEYYEVEEKTKKINVYKLEATGEEVKLEADEEDEEVQVLIAQGYKLDRTKKVRYQRVRKYLIDGNRVIEDMGYVTGKYIPIIPFYAKRGYVDNIERIQGHVRLTTDLMRLYNMLVSLLAEISIQSPIEKPILTPEQIQGHEYVWARDNIDRNPYLLINPLTQVDGSIQAAGPVGYTKPPNIPPALAGLLQLCNIDLKELLGNAEAGEEVVSNISAKAIELIQSRLDMQTFIYMDGFAEAMRHCGVVWLEMAREAYHEEGRKMKTVGVDGEINEIELNRPILEDGGVKYKNDLSEGKFDVITDVGPSFMSRRDATVRTLSSLLQFTQDPTERAAITGMILANLDGEGLGDLKDWNRKRLVRGGIVKPSDQELEELQAEMANQKPDAQQQYLEAEAENARAKAQKAQADTINALAEADKKNAETAEILAKTDSEKLNQIMTLLQSLTTNMPENRQTVASLDNLGIQ